MTPQKRILIATLGTMVIAGCDGSQTKASQADQTELNQLQEEKKTWEAEKTKMQESLSQCETKQKDLMSQLFKVEEELAKERQQNGKPKEDPKEQNKP